MIASTPNHTQRLQMESLGFECVQTEDSQLACWHGYGLALELPVKLEATHDDAMRAIIAASRADGKREHQKVSAEFLKHLAGPFLKP